MDTIVNKVSQSDLITLDLRDFLPKEERVSLDISPWLKQGILLVEKEFREQLKDFSFEPFKDKHVALHCSTEAILPGWAFALVSTYLVGVAKSVKVGSLLDVEESLIGANILAHDFSVYQDKPIILKGCNTGIDPQNNYLLLIEKLYPVARSIMYGEACSTVPLYKKKAK
ncbi:MAG: hypothetical protein C4K58_00935 [Flavobacteriaceae bacterium]|nr:MAG: hypothetical protein C4K58_00935 [Flavobacteriaceae bacterium]